MGRRERKRLNPRFMALCLAAVFLTVALCVWFYLGGRSKLPGARAALPDYVTEDLLTPNEYSRPGTELTAIRGVVIHYVGNPGTSAEANRNYFEGLKEGADGIYASAHFIVGLDGEVIQCIPLTEWAYASNSRNEDTVSIEVCHTDDTGAFSDVTYARVVELTAWLCREFKLDTDDVIRHYDVSGKDCPKYYVEHPEAWEAFLADVDGEMRTQAAEKS